MKKVLALSAISVEIISKKKPFYSYHVGSCGSGCGGGCGGGGSCGGGGGSGGNGGGGSGGK